MRRIKMDPWYSFELDDYSAPSCTSSTKLFFGTAEDFKRMLERIPAGKMNDLKCTFDRFEAGERRITHFAGYIKTRFAVPVQVLGEKTFDLKDVNYLYENSYGFYYRVRLSRASGTAYLLKRNKMFYLTYRVEFEDAEYSDAQKKDGRWFPLGEQIWGHPGSLNVEGRKIKNSLALIDTRFENEQVARARFDDLSLLDWHAFFEEVFGDG